MALKDHGWPHYASTRKPAGRLVMAISTARWLAQKAYMAGDTEGAREAQAWWRAFTYVLQRWSQHTDHRFAWIKDDWSNRPRTS